MDRKPSELSIDAAKDRLRESARKASPAGYVEQHPVQTLGIALLAGLLVGRMRLPKAYTLTLAQYLLPFAVRQTWTNRPRRTPDRTSPANE
jgi:hypothetical protein